MSCSVLFLLAGVIGAPGAGAEAPAAAVAPVIPGARAVAALGRVCPREAPLRIDCDGDGEVDLLFPSYHEGLFSSYMSPEMGAQFGMIGAAIAMKSHTANKNFMHAGLIGGASHGLLWSFKANAMINAFFASPEDGKLFLASHDDHIYALELKSGKTLWQQDLKGNIVGLSGSRQEVVAVSAKNAVMAFRPADGGILWQRPVKVGIMTSPSFGVLLSDEKTLYVSTLDDHVYALEWATGNVRWDFESKANSSLRLLTRDALLVAVRKELVALETASGAVRWRIDLGGYVHLDPVLDLEDKIVLRQSSKDSNLMAIDLRTGKILWSVAFDKAVRDKDRTIVLPEDADYRKTSLIVQRSADGKPQVLFSAGRDAVMAVQVEDGKILWSAPVREAQELLLAGDRLVVADKKYFVRSLNVADGAEKWRHEVNMHVAQMERLGGRLLLTLYSKELFSLGFEDGGSPAVVPLGEPYRLVRTATDRVVVCSEAGSWEYAADLSGTSQ